MSAARAARLRRLLWRAGLPVLIVLAVKRYGCDSYRVRENSMWPALVGGRDRVWVDKTAGLRDAIARDDVVVFRRDGTAYVKRVLGTGGESVTFRGGDLFVRRGAEEFARPPRAPEAVAAVRAPIYPPPAGAPGGGFRPADGAALELADDGILLRPTAPQGTARALLQSPGGATDGVLRDDHPGGDDRLLRGRFPVADVAVEIGRLRLGPGASVAVVHRLRGEARTVLAGADGLAVVVEEDGAPPRRTDFPGVPVPAGLRIETLDGLFTVSVRRDDVWRELWREPRATERHGGWSSLAFEVRGGEATLGALAVTRDAHYVDADGRDECPVWTVPPNEYFLVGDNAAVSTDSRVFGTVGPAEILGRVAGVWRR